MDYIFISSITNMEDFYGTEFLSLSTFVKFLAPIYVFTLNLKMPFGNIFLKCRDLYLTLLTTRRLLLP